MQKVAPCLRRPARTPRERHRKKDRGRDVGGLQEMRMVGRAREETQVRRRVAMIASQHVVGNYNVVFFLSHSQSFSLPLPAIHTFLSYKPVCSRLMGSLRQSTK